jgi:hypothetical protein
MKKITLLAAAFVAITFASCKKDRTCVCTDNSGGVAYVATTVVKSTKKSAEEWCAASNGSKTTVTYGGVAVPNSGTNTTSCALK